jgi:Ca2+-binding EF-hand superfamily protein
MGACVSLETPAVQSPVYQDAKNSLISKDIADVEMKERKKKERERIRVIFDRFDADRSGGLDRDEISLMCTEIGGVVMTSERAFPVTPWT